MITQLDLFNQDFVVDDYEIWRDVVGFQGLYEVSNFGRVRSWLDNHGSIRQEPKILKAANNGDGYLYVVLCKNGKVKLFYVHRLVAKAFIENPENLPQVNHKDEDKTNNHVENLEWCTAKYNNNYGTRTEKTSKPVISSDSEGNEEWFPSIREAERRYGFKNEGICMCLKGRQKTCGGRTWRYA